MRDDLNKLPLPPEAKSYARRHGLAAMKKQPQSFIDMNAAVLGEKDKKKGFKNTDEVGTVKSAVKESARLIVACLLEADEDFHEWKVWLCSEHPKGGGNYWAIEVPVPFKDDPYAHGHNEVLIPTGTPEEKIIPAIEQRMSHLSKTRNYPDGSFFVTPWGMYLIHGGTIGKM
jgi:hypothetical protein